MPNERERLKKELKDLPTEYKRSMSSKSFRFLTIKLESLWRLLIADEFFLVTQNPENLESIRINKAYRNDVVTEIGKVCRNQEKAEEDARRQVAVLD